MRDSAKEDSQQNSSRERKEKAPITNDAIDRELTLAFRTPRGFRLPRGISNQLIGSKSQALKSPNGKPLVIVTIFTERKPFFIFQRNDDNWRFASRFDKMPTDLPAKDQVNSINHSKCTFHFKPLPGLISLGMPHDMTFPRTGSCLPTRTLPAPTPTRVEPESGHR